MQENTSAWDIPLKKEVNSIKLNPNSKVFNQDQSIVSINKQNIFNQPAEFYMHLNLKTDSNVVGESEKSKNTININSVFSNPTSSSESNKIITFLNSLGIPIGNNQAKEIQKLDTDCFELFCRMKTGVYDTNYMDKDLKEANKLICPESHYSYNTKDGRYLIINDHYGIVLYCFEEKKIINKKKMNNQILNASISSKGLFFFCIEKVDKEKFILSILDVGTLEKKYEKEILKYKREQWPLMKFDNNDEYCLRKINPEQVEVLDAKNEFQIIQSVKLDKFNYFYISPNVLNCSVAFTYVEQAQGFDIKSCSTFKLYKLDNLSVPIFTKTLEKAQEINPYFSPDGKNILIMTQTYMDETGKSYYGEMSLFHFEIETKVLKKVPTYEGPIHDVSWNPNSEEFIVISGFMPAYSVLFDKNCKGIFEFGRHHKNTIKWSPLSHMVILGGFGNLSGDIEIWETKKFEKLGECKSNSAVSCIWAPDGRKFLTGVLNPRLRVDNNFKIFKYNGKLINSVDLSYTELYEVDWRNSNKKFQDFCPSPKENIHHEEKKEEKPRKIFKPKGTGMLSAIMKAEKQSQGARVLKGDEKFGNDDYEEKKEEVIMQKYPPGYIPPPEPKKKKKRIRKKKDKENPNDEADGNYKDDENGD